MVAAGFVAVVLLIIFAAFAFSESGNPGIATDASGVAARGTEQTNLPGSARAVTGGTAIQAQGTASSARVSARLGGSVAALGTTIEPLSVVEDSRCPQGVQCIQAGTVRVRVRVAGMEQVLPLGGSVTTSGATVTLIAVTPYPQAGSAVSEADYAFAFSVARR